MLLVGALRTFAQDSSHTSHLKDTIFPKVDSLKAAIVTASLRPRMKGDTTEYNTEHIRLRPNANVEELLGRLPGLQIDANGNITYNGEKIQHLLVDGEDIFGNNPTLVTRNFDASKISRVQVLDRKSDQALFTGVDDGTRTKTLNLVLKESAKDGYFGKVEAGGNADGYYNSNVALAAFRNKEQFTALGLAANTGILGLSNNSGGGSGSITFANNVTDALGASAGTGIPTFSGAALHYANTWNSPQDHMVSNYQYSHFFTEPLTTTQTVQVQPHTTYEQNIENRSTNRQDQHWFYGLFDLAPTSNGTFRLSLRASSASGENQFYSTSAGKFNDTLTNRSQRSIRDDVNQHNLGGDVFWRTLIGRPERILSAGISLNKLTNSTEGYLYSLNQFYSSSGVVQERDTVDQRKKISSQPLTIGSSISYTEPLWRGTVLAASYGISVLGDNQLQATYGGGNGKYEQMVDSLSSHFQTRTTSQRAMLNLQGKLHQLSYVIGSDWLFYNYRQKDLLADSTLRQHYLNWAPRVIVTYTPNASWNIRFYYTASTQQPSLAQLQPAKNNNDPLHITLGNPDLRPTLNQNINIGFQQLKTWTTNLNFSISLMSNSISTKTVTDSMGRQISQPVNVDGGRSMGMSLSLNRKVLGFDAGIRSFANYSRSVNYVNADLSNNENFTGGSSIALSQNVPDKYQFQVSTNFNYFYQVSSVNSAAPIQYWNQNHYGTFTVYVLRKYEINTNATYNWQQKTSAFASNTSVLLWNGYVARNFLQNRLVVKIQANNLLNANAGISRSNNGNVNTETSTNILGRYWMLSAIYHFDRKFKKK